MKRISSLKPGVDKFWLLFVASLIWSGVGIYLDFLAYGWLKPLNIGLALVFVLGGLLFALGIYLIMFKRFFRGPT